MPIALALALLECAGHAQQNPALIAKWYVFSAAMLDLAAASISTIF